MTVSKPRAPFSLVSRIMALAVGVSVVTLVLNTTLLFVFVQPLGDELIERMVVQVRSTTAALEAVPPAGRDAFVAALSDAGVSLSRAGPPPGNRSNTLLDANHPLLKLLAERLGDRGKPTLSADAAGRLHLSVSVRVGDDSWWMSLPSAQPPPIAWTLLPVLSALGMLAVAAVLALVIGVRLITRPMSQLAVEMLSRRQELRQIEEPERVSIELQGVIRSFNSLVHAVELSSQSRHDLLAGVSHDLRTPLARLRLRAETECDEETSQRMEPDFLAMSRIIDQFLAYAQGQRGVAIGEMQPIADVADAVVEQYRVDAVDAVLVQHGESALRVPDLGTQRALVNLIDNALAHGRGAVQVELSCDGSAVNLVVYDEGRGIAEDELDRALQPFVRFGHSPGHGGHCGLGLAIVAQFAEQLGGRIVLRPFDGRRSGVGFSLPV